MHNATIEIVVGLLLLLFVGVFAVSTVVYFLRTLKTAERKRNRRTPPEPPDTP